jgi:ABC-2 type transport system ATP-binding protein
VPDDIIVVEGLTVKFGDFTAVDDISLSVRRGEIYGFLGPNGAGKTTTARAVTTMRRPTAGRIVLDGHDVAVDAKGARELIGVCQQNLALDVDISIRENIISKGVLHRIPRKELEARMMELSEIIGLTPYLDKLHRDLSGGWKRKTVILCALIHKPSILFLDEPTAGLDTQSRHMLWDIIRILNKRGTTVFITTHYMDEAESLCDRVSIITKGKIRATGTPRELCEKFGSFTVEYNADDGKRLSKFFKSREEAKEFYTEKEFDGAVLRGTHLEDVFLEYSGKIDVSRIEEVLE